LVIFNFGFGKDGQKSSVLHGPTADSGIVVDRTSQQNSHKKYENGITYAIYAICYAIDQLNNPNNNF
jgi:hypothetical protein